MPLLMLHTSVPLDGEKQTTVLAALSRIVAERTAKPESVVMVTCQSGPVLLAGEDGGAFVDVRGIGGLTREVNNAITKDVCALLKEQLSLPPDRVYITFTDVPGENWGWNERTFR